MKISVFLLLIISFFAISRPVYASSELAKFYNIDRKKNLVRIVIDIKNKKTFRKTLFSEKICFIYNKSKNRKKCPTPIITPVPNGAVLNYKTTLVSVNNSGKIRGRYVLKDRGMFTKTLLYKEHLIILSTTKIFVFDFNLKLVNLIEYPFGHRFRIGAKLISIHNDKLYFIDNFLDTFVGRFKLFVIVDISDPTDFEVLSVTRVEPQGDYIEQWMDNNEWVVNGGSFGFGGSRSFLDFHDLGNGKFKRRLFLLSTDDLGKDIVPHGDVTVLSPRLGLISRINPERNLYLIRGDALPTGGRKINFSFLNFLNNDLKKRELKLPEKLNGFNMKGSSYNHISLYKNRIVFKNGGEFSILDIKSGEVLFSDSYKINTGNLNPYIWAIN